MSSSSYHKYSKLAENAKKGKNREPYILQEQQSSKEGKEKKRI
jgi:hypothetical protein